MTLASMANNILRFTPGLNLDLIKSTIQDSYRYLCSRDWNRLKIQRQITLIPPYSTGTIEVDSSGAVTGTGTSFTSSMIGSFFRVKGSDSFFTISEVTSSTSLTLEDWSGETIPSGTSYTIFKLIYTIPSSIKHVWNVVHQIPLAKKSQHYFNSIDPARLATSNPPYYWALAGISSTGQVQIEVYPTPSATVTLRIYGKRGFSPLADNETAILPEDLIEAHALLNCYRLKGLKEPGQGWEERMAVQAEYYNALLTDLENEDYQLDASLERVKDRLSERLYFGDNFALSHDVD